MIEVPEQYVGAVMEKLGARKAEIVNMGTRDTGVSIWNSGFRPGG